MSDLHDERIRELEEIIVAMPYIAYRFEVQSDYNMGMPEADILEACAWLHRVDMERGNILKKRVV